MIVADAYFAGLFDGEGCVQIRKKKPHGSDVNATYQLSITIASIDRRPLDALKSHYGLGGIYSSGIGRLTLSPAFQWVAVSNQACTFLRSIRPYCRIKGEEIDVALACQADIVSKKGGGKRHSKETLDYREACRQQLRTLKRRFRFHP